MAVHVHGAMKAKGLHDGGFVNGPQEHHLIACGTLYRSVIGLLSL